MTILGIETSTAVCSVGLARKEPSTEIMKENAVDLLSEKSMVESHIHSEKLLTLIQDLCQEQDLPLTQIDGIAVSIGPGSFTGLRIGLSTAKGLSYALGKPLITVPTFDSIAKNALMVHVECERIIVCIDAKQREYYIGMYEQRQGMQREVTAVHIGTLSSAVQSVSVKTVIVTDQVHEMTKETPDSIMIRDVSSYCRGDIIASLAIERWDSQAGSDWTEVEPKYLKDFVVRTQVKSGI